MLDIVKRSGQKNPDCTGWGGGNPGLYELWSNTVGEAKRGGIRSPHNPCKEYGRLLCSSLCPVSQINKCRKVF